MPVCVCVCVGASERRTERRGKRFRCFQGKVSGRGRKTAMGREGEGAKSPFAELNRKGSMDRSDGVI